MQEKILVVEDDDDVQTVFGNYDIPADVLEALAAE